MFTISFIPIVMAAMPNSFLSVVNCFWCVQGKNGPLLAKAHGRKSSYPSQKGVPQCFQKYILQLKDTKMVAASLTIFRIWPRRNVDLVEDFLFLMLKLYHFKLISLKKKNSLWKHKTKCLLTSIP